MTAPAAGPLYTRNLLALATDLADWPFDPALPLSAEAHSRSCGSVVTLSCAAPAGRIERLGLMVRACAVGQAGAALFARSAEGRDASDVGAALAALERWLAGSGGLPDWPGLAVLEPARAFPARHSAMLLPWKAALAALSKPEGQG